MFKTTKQKPPNKTKRCPKSWDIPLQARGCLHAPIPVGSPRHTNLELSPKGHADPTPVRQAENKKLRALLLPDTLQLPLPFGRPTSALVKADVGLQGNSASTSNGFSAWCEDFVFCLQGRPTLHDMDFCSEPVSPFLHLECKCSYLDVCS